MANTFDNFPAASTLTVGSIHTLESPDNITYEVVDPVGNGTPADFVWVLRVAAGTGGTDFTPGDGLTFDTSTNPDTLDVDLSTNSGLEFNSSGQLEISNPYDPDLPLSLWSGTRDYVAGEQVIHDGGSNVNSIYIANKAITGGTVSEPAPEPQSFEGQQDWYLSRSGIVSVQGPNDAGPAGLTSNDTLRLHAGGGITINRSGADFTIGLTAHGHSDPANFAPGFVYSFTDISVADLGYHHGTVGSVIGNFNITSARLTVRQDGGEDVMLFGRPIGGAIPAGIHGFVTSETDRGDITPNRADANSIIYVQVENRIDNGSSGEMRVLQADPSFTSQGNIANVINLQGTLDANRQINRTLTTARSAELYDLVDDGTAGVIEPWALEGNDDNIPTDKLRGFDSVVDTDEGQTAFTIDTSWLPRINTVATAAGGGSLAYNTTTDMIDFTPADVGGMPVHASLQVGFGISPTSRQEGLSSVVVTGTPTAMVRDGQVGIDVVNSITITSAHSTLRNNLLAISSDNTSFTWDTSSGDAPQTVTFTCSFSVEYTIGGITMTSDFNRSANFVYTGAPVLFWTGTLTQDQITNATDDQLQAALTEMSNFNSPFTTSYTGAESDIFAALYVPNTVTISRVSSEGFVFDVNTRTAGSMTLYTVTAPISVGTHEVTWRT